uniref:C-type lectin domain-containing protein n=1 Tax=Cyprinodon variegatus TaxID=28743 RepID=A0A3Q2CQD8_CYPVA
ILQKLYPNMMVCQLYEYHYIRELKTWTEAQQYCRENHTDLATVSNMADMKRLLNNSAGNMNEAWIGLYDQTYGDRTWYWSLPGVEFNETNWKPGEPNDIRTENCGIISNPLKWGDNGDCKEKKPFICYDDNLVLVQEKMNWANALSYCREHYHDLVTIKTLEEQILVQEKAKKASTPFVWLALRYNCTKKFWIWVCPEGVTERTMNSDGEVDDCNISGAMDTGGQHKWFQINGGEEFNFICSKI